MSVNRPKDWVKSSLTGDPVNFQAIDIQGSMQIEELRDVVLQTLDDMKAKDVVVLDVRGKTSITDIMIVASGTSDRHVKSIAQTVAFKAKQAGEMPLGTEGMEDGEWALVDLNGVVVHVMLPKVRDFYHLERLWSLDEPDASAQKLKSV
jgi:ribosome-associated protein